MSLLVMNTNRQYSSQQTILIACGSAVASFVLFTILIPSVRIIVSEAEVTRSKSNNHDNKHVPYWFQRFFSSTTGDKKKQQTPEQEEVAAVENNNGKVMKKQNGSIGYNNHSETQSSSFNLISVHPIGIVRSIYRLCVGTPRQGLLVPSARGRIELIYLSNDAATEAVDGLQEFSHVWIIFLFHLNNNNNNNNNKNNNNYNNDNNNNNNNYNNTQSSSQSSSSILKGEISFDSTPSKISPPALGGLSKVGVLATRSPHRYNPIGITLVKLDSIRTVRKFVKGKKKPQQTVILDISGLDLVDETPVLDIKPYVPIYDAPPFTCTNGNNIINCQLPTWVSNGLQMKRTVVISEIARKQLQSILLLEPNPLEFYTNNEIHSIISCIEEVLAIDVRSTYQTRKVRSGKFRAERTERFQQQHRQHNDKSIISNNSNKNGKNKKNSLSDDDSRKQSTGNIILEKNNNDTTMLPQETEREEYTTQQLDNLLIHYSIEIYYDSNNITRKESLGSGAEDKVIVQKIELIK